MKSLKNLITLLCLLALVSCNQSKEAIRLQGLVFGTSYSIIYYNDSQNYQDEIQQLFDSVNKSTSIYIPNSDISRINRGEEGVRIDAYFKEVFQKSERIFKETNGYFDPTVGNLVNAWGFGPQKSLNNLSQKQIDSLMQFVGFDKVKLNKNTVVKDFPEIQFDFNAVGKGYGVDVIGRFLESKGIQNYLVEIGGEVRCRGKKPDGVEWTIQIESPNTDGTRSAYDVVRLTDVSVASSGNYRKFRVNANGEKFVHTINPKSGLAQESNLLAATVIAKLDCADVDAYATAFMAMGFEKSKAFLKDHPELKVIFIYTDSSNNINELRTL